jgi:Spy/CpxP family protein refolding chaperone
MKKLTVLVATLVALVVLQANPAHAQGQGRGRAAFPGLSLVQMTAPLQTKLKLTDEQKTKLTAISETAMQERQAAFQEAQNGGDRQAIFAKIQENAKKHEESALALLNAEQKTQYEGWKKESETYSGLGAASVGLLGVDGLNDEQKTKLKALAEETKTKSEAINQSGQAGAERRTARQALQTETEAAIAKILSADQVKQLTEATPRFGRRQNQ